jgi:TonB family protein
VRLRNVLILVCAAAVAYGCATGTDGAQPRSRQLDASDADCPPTAYPTTAIMRGAAGETRLRLRVDASGRVLLAVVVSRSGGTAGHVALDSAARLNAWECRFPASPDRAPIDIEKVYAWLPPPGYVGLPKTPCIVKGPTEPGCSVAGVPRPTKGAFAYCPKPEYPGRARKEEATGTTQITVIVEPSGEISGAAITRSSGNTSAHAWLDELALQSVEACRAPPAPGYAPARTVVTYRWLLVDAAASKDNNSRPAAEAP